MALSYEPLWKLLDQIHISKMEFAKKIDISNATLAKLGKNEPVTLTIIEKICSEFHCTIDHVVIHIEDTTNDISIESLQQGAIITCPCPSIILPVRKRIEKSKNIFEPHRTCVILKNRILNKQEGIFFVAPIKFGYDPENLFDVPFQNAEFLSEIKRGNIELSKCSIVHKKNIDNVSGNIPTEIINTINNGILLDIISIMLKYNLVTEASLYNAGFDDNILNSLNKFEK